VFAFLPSPSTNGFHVGPLFVHAYGLAYVLALAAAITLTTRRWERRGGERALVQEVALWGFPAGLVGGRLYHLATSWNEVPHHWWGPFAIWKGGLGIWGGIAAGTLAGLWVLRRRHADIPAFMDAAAPGLLVAQAIGRVGNYFNQELFGGPTSLPWGLEIDPAHRPAGYERFATFHPTFLYELVFSLALAAALVWLGRRGRVRAPGLFALYVAGYSLARIGEELLRVDPAHHLFGLRLNFYVATVLFLVGLGWFARIQRLKLPWRRIASRGPALLAAGGITAALCGCGQRATAYGAATASSSRAQLTSPAVRVALATVNRPPIDLNLASHIDGAPERQIALDNLAYDKLPANQLPFAGGHSAQAGSPASRTRSSRMSSRAHAIPGTSAKSPSDPASRGSDARPANGEERLGTRPARRSEPGLQASRLTPRHRAFQRAALTGHRPPRGRRRDPGRPGCTGSGSLGSRGDRNTLVAA